MCFYLRSPKSKADSYLLITHCPSKCTCGGSVTSPTKIVPPNSLHFKIFLDFLNCTHEHSFLFSFVAPWRDIYVRKSQPNNYHSIKVLLLLGNYKILRQKRQNHLHLHKDGRAKCGYDCIRIFRKCIHREQNTSQVLYK